MVVKALVAFPENERESVRGCDQRARACFTHSISIILRPWWEASLSALPPESTPVRFDDA